MAESPTSTFNVILVNYRSLADIRRLFRSGSLQGHRVTVVDNGDDPAGVDQTCRDFGAEAILLPSNVGFARAINHVVARVEVHDRPWLLLNPDITLTGADLAQLGRTLEKNRLDGVAPVLMTPNGRLQVGIAGAQLSLRSVAAYFLLVSHVVPWVRGIFFTRRQSRRATDAAWLCMACMLVAPDAFDRFGPIPEDELVYAEDIAWGIQATKQGARLQLVPSVIVGHEVGGSGGSAAWNGALERLCLRRLGPLRGALAVASIRMGLGVRNVVKSLTRRHG